MIQNIPFPAAPTFHSIVTGILHDPLFLWVMLGSVLFLLFSSKTFRNWKNGFDSIDAPIISSSDYLASGSGLQSLAVGKIAGDYVYNLQTNSSGRVMMLITLDHHTSMHIMAYGNKSIINGQLAYRPNHKWLEPVSLEGNFPDDFKMWCSKGRQVEVRQVFGPETMAQFADLCRAYNFELFDECIYVSVAEGAHDDRDSTTMVTDVTNFLIHNRPVFDHLTY